jgi:hypothetical protein
MESWMPYGIQQMQMQNELPENECDGVIECIIINILQI